MGNNDESGQAGTLYAKEHASLVVVSSSLEGEVYEADNGKVWLVSKA